MRQQVRVVAQETQTNDAAHTIVLFNLPLQMCLSYAISIAKFSETHNHKSALVLLHSILKLLDGADFVY